VGHCTLASFLAVVVARVRKCVGDWDYGDGHRCITFAMLRTLIATESPLMTSVLLSSPVELPVGTRAL